MPDLCQFSYFPMIYYFSFFQLLRVSSGTTKHKQKISGNILNLQSESFIPKTSKIQLSQLRFHGKCFFRNFFTQYPNHFCFQEIYFKPRYTMYEPNARSLLHGKCHHKNLLSHQIEEVSSAYWENLYSSPSIVIPLINFLILF